MDATLLLLPSLSFCFRGLWLHSHFSFNSTAAPLPCPRRRRALRFSGGGMGLVPNCGRPSLKQDLFAAVQSGELETAVSILRRCPQILRRSTFYRRLSSLHFAASNGHIEMVSMLLDRLDHPDILNRHKQTPLMLAAMRGKIACVEKLLQAGANILLFDSLHGRTCLHYAAYYGHLDCLQAILQAARSNPIAESWGFARFVNIRDAKGATPLHLAAKQRRPDCIHALLEEGALVCASTGDYCYPGSTPLHLAARGGCLDCVRELLAWGADRLQMDSSGRMPYAISLKKKHMVCAALLDPSSAEPLVWPSPLKFISELKQDAKVLLEMALMEANREIEKKIFKGMVYSLPSLVKIEEDADDDTFQASELCCICYEHACSIEVQECGHQMCAHCILALCCHNKPNPTTRRPPVPVCPFCRRDIARLAVVKSWKKEETEESSVKPRKSRHSWNLSEGSSKGLSAAMGSFGKMSCCGCIADSNGMLVKP